MGNRIDIYDLPKRMAYYQKRLAEDPEVCEENKADINKFLNSCYSEGLSNSRVSIYLIRLYFLAKWLGKPFKQATKEDLQRVMADIERSDKAEGYKQFFRVTLKKYYKVMEGNNEVYPDRIKWIRGGSKMTSNKLPEELLTQEEVRRLIDSALNPRDKALVAVLYDSGCRVGELAGLQIKHISFNKHGAQIIVNGKTGMRRVLLLFAYPHLLTWLENHPGKGNPEAPLWCALTREKRGQALGYADYCTQLRKIAKRAGVTKKVNPHSFRHARATQLARLGLNGAQMSSYLGWVPNTNMAGVYVHLAGRDVDDALLKAHGLQPDEKQDTALPCIRCQVDNIITSKFCRSCGMPLTVNAAVELDDKHSKLEQKLTPLMELLDDEQGFVQITALIKELRDRKNQRFSMTSTS